VTREVRFSRWWLVAIAAIGIGMAGTYQFVWSSIRSPLSVRLGASETALGTVFTLFVIFQASSQFPAGWVRDRMGPRVPLAGGSLLLVAGYVGTAWAPNVAVVSLWYALGGIGAGTIYAVAISTPTKWFDDRRGLATGLVGFAYAGISFLLIPLVRGRITADFVGTMLGLAALVGVATLVGIPLFRDPDDPTDADTGSDADPDTADDSRPPEAETEPGDDASSSDARVGYTWRDAVQTWQFWLLYGIFVVVNGVGLMIVGKAVAFAEATQLPAAAATGAASLVALGDSAGVIAGGVVSDHFGRESTIALSLVACGGCLAGASLAAVSGGAVAYVGLIAAAAFFRSPVFSVIPSLVGDYYGTSHNSENYALLYSSKLWGGVVGGTVTSASVVQLGWHPTFLVGAGLLVAAAAATTVLRPVDPSPQ
jgi:OFA family oxalate/formate antiporter-like MFS transporter